MEIAPSGLLLLVHTGTVTVQKDLWVLKLVTGHRQTCTRTGLIDGLFGAG